MEEKEIITKEQVNEVLNAWDFLEFSNTYRNQYYNSGYYTPDIINRQMQNINMNPTEATIDGIERALKSPKESESILRNYATSLEIQNMYYKRLIRHNSDMPCWNLNFDVVNISNEKELNSKEFKEDLDVLDNFCKKFDFKNEFSIVLRQILRQGVFYCVLRDDMEKYVLQELPPDFCMITGRHDHGLLFDFNMNWFIGNYGTDINMYPKVFKKMYRDVYKNVSSKYNPSSKIENRNSTFVYWHQCSPDDGFWAWKINPELATIVPYYSALFPEMAMQPIVRGLQEDKYFIEASKLLVGILGMNKDNKSGNSNNQINITPDILGKFLGVARQGLAKQIGLTALPVDDIIPVEFDTKERNMLTEYIKNITDQSISSSAALLDDNKLNVHQSKLAAAIDENFINSMYPMFSNFIEYYVNKRTKKYKFKISLHDFNTPDNRAERQNKLKNMLQIGILDIQDISRVYDINPFEMSRRLSISKSMGLTDKLINLSELNIGSSKSNSLTSGKRGRPPKPNSDNDNTQNSIARGSNEFKKYE